MPPPPRILLVEDNHDHLRLTTRVLRRAGIDVCIDVARDGEDALAKLLSAGADGLPILVLLDLNMPKLSGREVLRRMKADAVLRAIPVVVVSSSNRQEDETFAAEVGAAGYISKGAGFEHYTHELTALRRFLPDPGEESRLQEASSGQ